MNNFEPYITADGSMGLYNKAFGDIYHSVSGAVTESLNKFVLPIDFNTLLKHNEIKILDVCFGIGYNSKVFLNYLYENQNNFLKIKKNILSSHADYSETIYTDNNFNQKVNRNNETIYSDKIFDKIIIHAADNDEILPYLSPFIKTGLHRYSKKYKLPDDKYNKYLLSQKNSKSGINNIINYIFYNCLYSADSPSKQVIEHINNLICEYKELFTPDLCGIFKNYYLSEGNNSLIYKLNSNLHNIYYRYISNRYKRVIKGSKIGEIDIKLSIDDARQVVKNDNLSYNLIFLDAFSPSKCPCLWTYEFFKELFRLLSDDGMLLTYSTSASVRSAMSAAGFSIGYIYDKNMNPVGTVCAKNSSLIKYPLCEFDLGLLKTRAGIFYHDENLTGQNEAIISLHNSEVENSERISTTNYIRQHKKEGVCMMS